MNDSQSCLSKEVLDRIGHDEILPHDLRAIEEHVTQCEHCRSLFATATAEPEWTESILPHVRSLSDDLSDSGGAAFDATNQWSGNDVALRLLGPTDDPRMLGRIGSYEVSGIIGRGGMGIVFKAFDAALNRFVAIKMLLPHLASSSSARKRFSREGRAAAAVIDDYVLPIFGVDDWQGVPYIVTQYSSGMSLQKRIHEQGPFESKEVLRIGLQVVRGLAAAHAQGLVHRDVKPSNILLDRTVERALLTDFGLARTVDDATITRSGTIAGTPQFMAPEQARGEAVDQRSDLFSLGAVMYAMCTGRPPFRADTSYGVMRRIIEEEPRAIREINPDIPDWLCNIVAKLMRKQPIDRFASAEEVADLLEECLAHLQQPTAVPLPQSIALPKSDGDQTSRLLGKRLRTTLAVIGGMFVAVAIARHVDKPEDAFDVSGSLPHPKDTGESLSPMPKLSAQEARLEIVEGLSPEALVKAIDNVLANLTASVHHGFGADGLPSDRFTVLENGASQPTEAYSDGIHVSHAGQKGYSNFSIRVRLRVHGNFDVTASFEDFEFEPCDDGSGAISLTAILENDGHSHVSVQRGTRIDLRSPCWDFVQSELIHSPTREAGVVWLGTRPETAPSGRLRLARVGETLYCLFAAGDSAAFRLIHSEKVGSDDLLFGGIRLNTGIQSNGDRHGMTAVVWKDLAIRAERITD